MLSPPFSTATSQSIPPPSSTTRHQPSHSPETLASLITTSKTIRQLLQIHAAAIRHGHENHPIVNFKLQRSYSSFGRLDLSLALFNRTHNPDVFFYTSIIHAYAADNLHTRGLQFYIQMISQDHVEPNEFTLSAILKGCPLEHGKILHPHAIKLGFDRNMHVRTALVDVYSRGGDLVSARQLFDTMPERSLVSLTSMIKGYVNHGDLVNARMLFDGMPEKDAVCWNVMIGGYAKFGKPAEALTLFRKMLTKMNPNEVTFVAVLSACGQIGAFESGKWIHSYMNNNRIPMNVHVGTALIDMYSKCGDLEDARLVFDKLKNKDVIAYNSMIAAYAMHGCCQEALVLFSDMCRRHTRPTDISFIGILNACAHSGLVSVGKGVFLSMKNKLGIKPSIEHYGCMVNLLGRAGYLETAYGFVKNMKVDPDPVIWGTLLDSCSLHGNVRLAEEIVKFLVDRNLANSGTYILLSNLYAAASNWTGVARMRSMMTYHGVQKEPGCSSIEVRNTVHEFVAGDVKHPNGKEIYSMLEEMNGWLKGYGYRPQTDLVFHDVGKTGKERSLAVHSEKLAIAFGLISTEAGSSIKIVKNLRVCLDCHEVMKLVSKITRRRIVVRDRNRFHHFADGSCSCGDYW